MSNMGENEKNDEKKIWEDPSGDKKTPGEESGERGSRTVSNKARIAPKPRA